MNFDDKLALTRRTVDAPKWIHHHQRCRLASVPEVDMKRRIKWKRDISGQTIEAFSDGKPLAAIPQKEGDLSCATQDWFYKQDTITFVEVQEVSNQRPCTFVDLATGQTIADIPHDAFDFID